MEEEQQQRQSPLLPVFGKELQVGNLYGIGEHEASAPLLRGALGHSLSSEPLEGQKLSPYYPLLAAQSSSSFQQCLQDMFPYNLQHRTQLYSSNSSHQKFPYCNAVAQASSSHRFHPYAESKAYNEVPFTSANIPFRESPTNATPPNSTTYSSSVSASSDFLTSALPASTSYTSSASPLNTLPSSSTAPNDLDVHTNLLARVLQSQFDSASQLASLNLSKEEFTRRVVEQYRDELREKQAERQAVSPLSPHGAIAGGPLVPCSSRIGPFLIPRSGDSASLDVMQTEKGVCSLPYPGKIEENWDSQEDQGEMRSQSPPPAREELSPLPPELDIPSSLTSRGRLHSNNTCQPSNYSRNSFPSQPLNASLSSVSRSHAPSSAISSESSLTLPHSSSSNLLAHQTINQPTLPGLRSISTSDNDLLSQVSSLHGPIVRARRGKPLHLMPPELKHRDSDEMSSSQDEEFTFVNSSNDPCAREGREGDEPSLHMTKRRGSRELRRISKVSYAEDDWDYDTIQPDRPEDFIFTTQELADRTAALKKVYSPEEAVECDLCGKVMRCSASLAAHMSKRHNKTLGEACFTCHLCGCVGTTRATLKRHLKRSHGTELHPDLMKKCGHCSEEVGASRSAVDAHIRARHPEQLSRYRQCSLCQALFTANASLARHLQRQHASDASVRVFECEHCSKRYYSYSQYTFHLKPVRSAITSKSTTDGRASQRTVLLNLDSDAESTYLPSAHQIDVKSRKPRKSRAKKPPRSLQETGLAIPELCESVDSESGGQVDLRKAGRGRDQQPPSPTGDGDVKAVSLLSDKSGQATQPLVLDGVRLPERKRHKCDRCMRSYRNHKNLVNHVLSKHEQPPKDVFFPCSKCDQVLLNSKARLRHMRTEHGERLQLRCGVCSLSFPTSAAYREHKSQHLFSCPHCGKTLMPVRHAITSKSTTDGRASQRTLQSNLDSDAESTYLPSGEKPYSCPYCTRRFSDKSACNSHVRVHTGAERCTCQFCGATFSKKQKLKYHMRLHTGQMLQCPLCPYAATMTYTLKKHLESHQAPVEQVLREAGLGRYLDQHPQLVTSSLQNLAHTATPPRGSASRGDDEGGGDDEEEEEERTRVRELRGRLAVSEGDGGARGRPNSEGTNIENLDGTSASGSQRKGSENISCNSARETRDRGDKGDAQDGLSYLRVKSEPTEIDQHGREKVNCDTYSPDDTGYESLIPETNIDPLECEQAQLMEEVSIRRESLDHDQNSNSDQEKDTNEVETKDSSDDDSETLDCTREFGESASDAKSVVNKLNEGILSNNNSIANVWLKEEPELIETCPTFPKDENFYLSKTEDLDQSSRSDEGVDSSTPRNNFLEDCTEDFEQRLKMKAFMQDQCLERSARSIRRAIQREQDLHEQSLLKPKRKRRAKLGDVAAASDDEERDQQTNALVEPPEWNLHKINKTARLKLNADAMERVVGALIKRMMELSEEEEERDPGQMLGACLQVVLRHDDDNQGQDQVVSVGKEGPPRVGDPEMTGHGDESVKDDGKKVGLVDRGAGLEGDEVELVDEVAGAGLVDRGTGLEGDEVELVDEVTGAGLVDRGAGLEGDEVELVDEVAGAGLVRELGGSIDRVAVCVDERGRLACEEVRFTGQELILAREEPAREAYIIS